MIDTTTGSLRLVGVTIAEAPPGGAPAMPAQPPANPAIPVVPGAPAMPANPAAPGIPVKPGDQIVFIEIDPITGKARIIGTTTVPK